MIYMQALEQFTYDGKDLQPGDPFIASEPEHARVLSIVGRAKIVEQSASGHWEDEGAPTAKENSAAKDEQAAKPASRRNYSRRDLTAEH